MFQDIDKRKPGYAKIASALLNAAYPENFKLPNQDECLAAWDARVSAMLEPSWRGNGKLLDLKLED